jgi:anti-sigma factor RsiW
MREEASKCPGEALTPYADGELDPGHALDVSAHVERCAPCSERLATLRALKRSLKREPRATCPADLRARMRALVEEGAPAPEARPEPMSSGSTRLRSTLVLAAAACFVLALGASRAWRLAAEAREGSVAALASSAARPELGRASLGMESLLEDLVALHAQPLPPETTNPEELSRFDPFVGVPVRRPAFQPFGARFNGARVVPAASDRRAALLQYSVGSHRVTVYVFDPRAVPVRSNRLKARWIEQRPVYAGKLRGYSVAAAESQHGVGYALATDLDDDESARLVQTAALQ